MDVGINLALKVTKFGGIGRIWFLIHKKITETNLLYGFEIVLEVNFLPEKGKLQVDY